MRRLALLCLAVGLVACADPLTAPARLVTPTVGSGDATIPLGTYVLVRLEDPVSHERGYLPWTIGEGGTTFERWRDLLDAMEFHVTSADSGTIWRGIRRVDPPSGVLIAARTDSLRDQLPGLQPCTGWCATLSSDGDTLTFPRSIPGFGTHAALHVFVRRP